MLTQPTNFGPFDLNYISLGIVLGTVVQSVPRLIADPGVVSLISTQSHTFVEIDHEVFSTTILLPLIQEGLVSVTSKSMHKVLVNRLV